MRVIHSLAQSSDVWTLDIAGEEWGEVDFPEDVAAAEALVKRWDLGKPLMSAMGGKRTLAAWFASGEGRRD